MLKETIEMAIKMGMEKFMISHFSYNGRTFEVSKKEIFDFIEGYENAIPMSCYFGTVYGYRKKYFNPTLCQIIYRLKDEDIPQ